MRVQVLLATLLLTQPALAHETLHQVVHGKAVAVRAYQEGAPLSLTPFEVYSPGEPGRAWTTGRTDREGWLAFVPSGPGRWRVRVIEATGHGLDLAVEVPPPVAAAATPGAPPHAVRVEDAAGASRVLRSLLGVGVIGLVFAALVLAWRKKGRGPPPGAGH